MSRRDDINKLYQPSKTLEKVCYALFTADIAISLIAACVGGSVISYLTVALVIIAFLYMAISIIDDGIMWFQAESARRKNSIQVAYDVRLDEYETEKYYNNNVGDPDISYATNLFESAFFTKEISGKMLLGAVAKLIVAVVVLIITCRFIANDDILLVIAQTVFSAVVIEDAIRLIIFTQRINTLYEEAYHELITVGISTTAQRVWLKFFCVEYESIKAHYRIRLSESLFNKQHLAPPAQHGGRRFIAGGLDAEQKRVRIVSVCGKRRFGLVEILGHLL